MAQRKHHGGAFKARVAVEAIAGHKTVNEIASAYEIHPSQVAKWKAEALARLPEVLSDGRKVQADVASPDGGPVVRGDRAAADGSGVLEKKAGALPLEQRRGLIEAAGCALSVREQCRLLGVPRSTVYYEPCGPKASDLAVMRRLDEQYTATPFYGVERMTACSASGRAADRSQPGASLAAADGPGGHLSEAAAECAGRSGASGVPVFAAGSADRAAEPGVVGGHHVHPLVAGVRVPGGDPGLVQPVRAVVVALDDAGRVVLRPGPAGGVAHGRPEIFNTDQGSQFTSGAWIEELTEAGVAISMDGRGRAFDNIFTERLWRSVKYEEVYLKDYAGWTRPGRV